MSDIMINKTKKRRVERDDGDGGGNEEEPFPVVESADGILYFVIRPAAVLDPDFQLMNTEDRTATFDYFQSKVSKSKRRRLLTCPN